MADLQDSTTNAPNGVVSGPTVGEADGWEVQSAGTVDQPRPEQIVERLSDVPGDEQVEQRAQKVAQDEKDAQAAEAVEAEEPVAKKTDGEEPAVEEPRKKSASERNAEIRTRIAAETKAYHEARRAREFEQSEIVRLRHEREQLQQQSQPQQRDEPAAQKPLWAKYEEAGKSYEDFLDDRAAYDRQQTIAATRQELQQREQQAWQRAQAAQQQSVLEQHAEAHEKRINEAAQKHEDFFEVVQKNLSDIPDNPFLVDVIQHHTQGAEILYHLAQNTDEARVLSTLDVSRPVGDAIRYSDAPIELLSHFARNPQELDRLNRMHPATALVALGEMKAQFKAAKDGSAATEISNAKPPIRPVGGGRSSTPKNPDDLPFGPEWIKRENQRDREKKKTSAYF